jgi:hypothetical protein
MKGGIKVSWTDRMKQTFDTFKRMAFPLYIGYLLFMITTALVFILSLLPVGIGLVQSGLYYSDFSGLSGIPGMPGLPGSPSVPVPPGGSYGAGAHGDAVSLLLSLGAKFIFSFFIMTALTLLVTAAFWTGLFHLTRKAYTDKAQFKDYSFKGFSRVLGWFGALTLILLIFVIIGIVITISLSRSYYGVHAFLVIYLLVLAAVAIFLAPWLSTGVFYILNHREFSLGRAFQESWQFYRRHMGSFWGCFLTALAIEILIAIFTKNSSGLSALLSFVVTPFISILPIVWVFTHEDGERSEPVLSSYGQPMPAPPVVPYSGYSDSSKEAEAKDPHQSAEPSVVSSSSYPPNAFTPSSNPEIGSSSDYKPQLYPLYPQSSTPPEAPQEPQINFCPTCGKSVRSGASYCSQCGTKL